MKIDLTGHDLALSYLEDGAEFDELWNSEALQIIREFGDRFRGGLSKEEMKKVLDAKDVDMYGLGDIEENLPQIEELLTTIENNREDWLETMEEEINRVLPEEDTSEITIHPIPTFFYGIGLQDGACLNINDPIFFEDPREFVYHAIHECTHVLYARNHRVPSIHRLESPEEKISFFNTFFHTEGFGVYAPLRLRKKEGAIQEENLLMVETPMIESFQDYLTMTDETKMRKTVEKYDSLRDEFKHIDEWDAEELLERTMGQQRYTYRVGGWLFKEIEEKKGLEEVREAFHMDPNDFVKEYDHLLDRLR